MKPSYLKRGNYTTKKLADRNRVSSNKMQAEAKLTGIGRDFMIPEDIKSIDVSPETNP